MLKMIWQMVEPLTDCTLRMLAFILKNSYFNDD